MKISVKKQTLETINSGFLIVNLFAGETKPGGGTGAVDKKLKGLISKNIKQLKFNGSKSGDFFIFDNPKNHTKKIMVISLGKQADLDFETIRQVAATSILEAKKHKVKTVATILHGAGIGNLDAKKCAQTMAEGFLLNNYSFNKYQKNQTANKNTIKEIIICQKNEEKISDIKKGINEGIIFAKGQNFARDLVNEPPEILYPKTLTEIAKQIAKDSSFIDIKIYTKKEIIQMNMGAFLAVDQGSAKDPYFIHLTYKPKEKPVKKIALVGKSITFDSGGLSLKPSDSMVTMKMDMAGGATILGIFSTLNILKPNMEIHGILPACENMPSGEAIKVDDIVKAGNGKTIEVVNTDAEGRMALADALVYAEKLKPDEIIDLATLTGAVIIALGNDIAALMTDNDKLNKKLTTASKLSGEKIWPLPLEKTYQEHIKSEVADIKNIGKKGAAGTISAGLFLKEFIKNTPWAHLDIAGPAWNETKHPLNQQIGGSGFGVRLLLEYILQK